MHYPARHVRADDRHDLAGTDVPGTLCIQVSRSCLRILLKSVRGAMPSMRAVCA